MIGLFILCTLVPQASLPDTIIYTVQISEEDLAFGEIGNSDLISIDGGLFILRAGQPCLPRIPLVFVIPAGSTVSDVDWVVRQTDELDGTFDIWPAQPAVPISWEDSIPTVPEDSVIYNLEEDWPSTVCRGLDVGAVDGIELARVDVYPVAWNPSTGEATLREIIDLEVVVVEDSVPAQSSIAMTEYWWDRRLESVSMLLANPDSLEEYAVAPTLLDENEQGVDGAPIAVDCVILTADDWASSWDPLVDWNIQRGLYTEVLTLSDIEDGADTYWDEGDDWPETIRNCVRWLHENLAVQYVLLGTDATAYGTGTPSTSEIPSRRFKSYVEYFPLLFPYSDWYYSCTDALFDWQTNSNPAWGEYYPPDNPNENDLMDLIPDVHVGRIPARSAAECRDAAVELVSYEKYSVSQASPQLDLLVVSANVDQGHNPATWEHLEEILSVVPSSIENVQWLAEQGCTGIPGVLEIGPQVVLEYLGGSGQDGGAYRVAFGGHGWIGELAANHVGSPGDSVVVCSDLRSLSGANGSYCTGYAFNCLTGHFVEAEDISILETWLGADGCVPDAPLGPSYIGNTEIGMNHPLVAGSTTHMLNKWFLDALYNMQPSFGTWGVGEVESLAKTVYGVYYLGDYPFEIPEPVNNGDEYEPMWDIRTSHLGGDPSCPLWISEPSEMQVSHPSSMSCPGRLTVTAETTGSLAIEGVRVCLMLTGSSGLEIYVRGLTDSSGEFSVYLDPSSGGRMLVTLTRQGYVPYEGEVTLTVE